MLERKTVLVTGAATGIGRAIARTAAGRGASVVVTALGADEAERVADDIRAAGGDAVATACDVTSRAAVRDAVAFARDRFGSLDAAVHSATFAASGEMADLEDVPDAIWDGHMAVSLTGLFHLAQEAGAPLAAARGSLLVLTSTAAFKGSARQSSYAAVKGAQRGFVKALAREWGPSGVRVNALSPSAMTPALEQFLGENPAMRSVLIERAALRRFGDPEGDIGPAACFLIGPDAAFVTGQTLIVDGGALMF